MSEEKKGLAGFFKKWGFLVAIGMVVVAFLFLLAPVVDFTRKYVPEGSEVAQKFYYSANFIGLFDSTITQTWPAIIIASLLGLGVASNVLSRFVPKFRDHFAMAAVFSYILAICMLFMEKEIFAYYGGELEMIEHFKSADIAWGAMVAIAFLSVAAFISFGETEYSSKSSARDMAEDGVLIALAMALDFLKIPMQVSGSINFQMLPLMIIALRRGPVQGFVCGGLVYGILSCIKDGYGFATFPFDYLVGFGSVFAMGYFRNLILPEGEKGYRWQSILWIVVAGLISTSIRFIGGTVSSMVIYGYGFGASMTYNVGYVYISGALAILALSLLQGPLAMVNAMYPAERHQQIGNKAE